MNKQDFIDRVNTEFDKLRSTEWVDLGNRHEEEVIIGPIMTPSESIKEIGLTFDKWKQAMIDDCVDSAIKNIIHKNTPDEGLNYILSPKEYKEKKGNADAGWMDNIGSIIVADNFRYKESWVDRAKRFAFFWDQSLKGIKGPLYASSQMAGQKRNFNSIKLIDIEDFDFDVSEGKEAYILKGSGKLVISY